MATVKIVSMHEIPSTQPGRLGRIDELVVYQSGDNQRGVVTVPSEGISRETIAAAIKAHQASHAALVGQSIEIP